MKTELPILRDTEEQKEKSIKNDPLHYESRLIFTLQTFLQDNKENTKNPNPEFIKKLFKDLSNNTSTYSFSAFSYSES